MKVFINPGHSLGCSPDAGCSYNGIKEATICAEIASQLGKLLALNNIEYELYQQQGSKLTANQQLNKVATVANASKADIFVSIHMNGFSNSSAHGTETWYSRGSQKGEKLAKLINEELIKPYSTYTLFNRGVKVDSRSLLVLRSTVMPAVLTEICFLSNCSDANFIKSHKIDVAQRLCTAICRYANVTPSFEVPTSIKTSPNEIKLVKNDNKYDCYVDNKLKLSKNELSTCLNWIKTNHA